MASGSMQGYGQPANQGRGMFGRGRIPAGRGQTMGNQPINQAPGMFGRGRIPAGRGQTMGNQPINQAPGMFGRGRIPAGRGQTMRGRTMPGFGGRGGRMPGRGRMMPGRGRMMMPGRGGRGRIPCKLDAFNRYVGFKIVSFCDRNDQENLGFAFPQFTPGPLSQQQQKVRMMKKLAENANELKNPYGINQLDLNDDETDAVDGNEKEQSTAENSKVNEEDTNGARKDEKKENTNDSNPGQSSIETEMDPVKKKKMMKEREENMRINMTDCHTLLAQLNTKRLYRRIKYFRRNDANYNVDKAYAYNKDTVEISELEWQALLDDYKDRRIKLQKQQAIKEAEKAERKANYRKSRKNKQKTKNKKKGKGNKKKNTEGVAEEEEAASTKQADDDTSLVEEQGSDNDAVDCSDDEIVDFEGFEYVGDKPSKYELLMFTPCPRAVAVLASYPRSGNSLMRNLYEKITLRVTGSDMMGGLQKHDLVGEMATGTNNVQFVKTHYPERMGHPPFKVSRAVLLVRNPYDAMDSYFNLMSTSTHTTSLTPEARKKYAKLFADMAMKEILVWRDFHEYWLKQKIPLMVVRYEDLIRDTVKVISKVIKFVLEINSMTFFEDRIQRAIGEEQVEKLGPYKARSGGIGKSLTKGNYTPELLNYINYGIVGTMEKFGYKEMMIPNPSKWKLEPLDQWGVYIPGSSDEPMIINQKGLVRGPNRQTNWRQVKMLMEKDKKEAEGKALPESVNLV